MSKYLVSLTLLVFLAAASWSQDDSSGTESVAESEADTAAEAITEVPETEVAGAEEIVGDEDLDVQTYEEDEDDFVPSEEIPADEPIPFPSNI